MFSYMYTADCALLRPLSARLSSVSLLGPTLKAEAPGKESGSPCLQLCMSHCWVLLAAWSTLTAGAGVGPAGVGWPAAGQGDSTELSGKLLLQAGPERTQGATGTVPSFTSEGSSQKGAGCWGGKRVG